VTGYARLLMVEDMSRRDRDGSKDIKIVDPGWPDIEAAIRAMDGVDRSYVVLWPTTVASDEQMLLVGHGRDGKLVCTYYDGDEYTLIDPTIDSDEVVEVLIGQASHRLARELVGVDGVLAAVRTYVDSGAITGANWVKQEL
jgi:hypothetical protein